MARPHSGALGRFASLYQSGIFCLGGCLGPFISGGLLLLGLYIQPDPSDHTASPLLGK
jgi:hypothetical protein